MMVTARVFPEASGYSAHCDQLGVYTQGTTRVEAIANLAEAIALQIGHEGLSVHVDDLDAESVRVTANDPARLAAEVLKQQQLLHARKSRSVG